MGNLTNPILQPLSIPARQDRIASSYAGDVFLFNPGNRQFLEGKTQQLAPQNPRTGYILLFLLPFLLVGVSVLIWAGVNLYQWNEVNQTGIGGVADISDKHISSSDGSDTYYLSYRFSNGENSYTHEQSVSSGLYNRTEIGSKLDIIYVPDQPNIVVITGRANVPWFPMGFAICWNLLVWPIFVSTLAGIWKNRLLEKQGHVIDGQVVASKGSTDSDGDFTLQLTYTFYSPNGSQLIQGTAQHTRNDLKESALLAPGAHIAILYRKDNHHKPL
ncbi:MAG: DUF3592 domain-containing protein [Chloroflexota bacterium]